MAIQGTTTLNEISILEVDADPRVTATDAPIGSLAILDATGETFKKFGSGTTDWNLLAHFETAQATATNDISTTSTTDTLVTGMTLTPSRGRWLVFFTGQANASLNSVSVFFSVYVNGVQQAASQIFHNRSSTGGRTAVVISGFPVDVTGSQAVEIRWRVSAGTGNLYSTRTMTMVRAG